MLWTDYVNSFGRLFYELFVSLLYFVRQLTIPFSQLEFSIPNPTDNVFINLFNTYISVIFDFYGDYSILTLVLGYGIWIYFAFIFLKWLLNLIYSLVGLSAG